MGRGWFSWFIYRCLYMYKGGLMQVKHAMAAFREGCSITGPAAMPRVLLHYPCCFVYSPLHATYQLHYYRLTYVAEATPNLCHFRLKFVMHATKSGRRDYVCSLHNQHT